MSSMPAVPAPSRRDNISAVAEAGIALVLMIGVTNFASSQLGEYIPSPKYGGVTSQHAFGALQVAVIVAVLAVVYGSRFRPGQALSAACGGVLRALLSALRPRLCPASLLLLTFHAAQMAWIASDLGMSVMNPQLWTCGSWTSILWAPAYEELLFRVALFSILLHRSRGNALFSVAAVSSIFAAIHLPNVLTGSLSAYVLTQTAAAAVVGACYALLYASGGSAVEVVLLHAANNAAAVAWMARDDVYAATESLDNDSEAAAVPAAAACTPRVTLPLLMALNLLLVVYSAAAVMAWRSLHRLIQPTTTAGATDGDDTHHVSSTGQFRKLHPLVYGASRGPTASHAVSVDPVAPASDQHTGKIKSQ